MREGKWEIEATMGAVQALRDNAPEITEAVLANAEDRAVRRSVKDKGRSPAIMGCDVIAAIAEARELGRELADLSSASFNNNARDVLSYLCGWFKAEASHNAKTAREFATALRGAMKPL